MSSAYENALATMQGRSFRWLVTGAAGFIGSHLVETLLRHGQQVVGLDNLSTGHRRNLDSVQAAVPPGAWKRMHMVEGDIRDSSTCHSVCEGVDFVLHQAALGSVPRSLADPQTTHASNVDGFLNMLVAARDAKVKRFVYAASSSTYGDHPKLPKIEHAIGRPLSPYAVTKLVNELYADVFGRCYGLESIGLRYFNVFGPRQDPQGAYAAVIPRWAAAILQGSTVYINGDGQTSRDFCFVENAVQANILAATTSSSEAVNQVYNVAVGEQTTLIQLHRMLADKLQLLHGALDLQDPIHRGFRSGDVRHSLADISKARRMLGYEPTHRISEGLDVAARWYLDNLALVKEWTGQ